MSSGDIFDLQREQREAKRKFETDTHALQELEREEDKLKNEEQDLELEVKRNTNHLQEARQALQEEREKVEVTRRELMAAETKERNFARMVAETERAEHDSRSALQKVTDRLRDIGRKIPELKRVLMRDTEEVSEINRKVSRVGSLGRLNHEDNISGRRR